MTRAIETRLAKLEAAAPPRTLRIVWSDSSDLEEWDRTIAELIANGTAKQSDDFLRIGWTPATSSAPPGLGPWGTGRCVAREPLGHLRQLAQDQTATRNGLELANANTPRLSQASCPRDGSRRGGP